MDRDLVINLKISRQQATQQSEAFHSAERTRIDSTKTAHGKAEGDKAAAAEKSVKQQVVSLESLAVSGLKVQDRLRAAAEKRAVEDAAAQRKAVESQVVSLQSLAASGLKVQDRLREAAKKRADEEKKGHEQTAEAITGAVKQVAAYGASMLGLGSATAVISAITGEFDRARESAYKSVQLVKDYRESLLELAALKGRAGQSTAEVAEDVAFRRATLQSKGAATAFQLTALGVGESSVDTDKAQRLISRPEFGKAMALGGAFQAMEGGDPTAHAQLVGMIPSLIGRRTTGEEVYTKEQQLFKIFQPGSFSFSSGANQFAKLAPLVTSGQLKDTEAAALLSAFSTTNREGAGENVQQFMRATVGGIDRAGKPRVAGAEAIGAYFKSLGLTEDVLKHTEATRLPFVIADKVVVDLEQQQKEAAARGEAFSGLTYLRHKGYMNQEDAATILQYQGLTRTRALQDTFLPLAADAARPTAEQALAPVAAFQANDPVAMARRAAYGEEAANIGAGAGRPETVDAILRNAFNLRRARGQETYASYDEIKDRTVYNSSELLFPHLHNTRIEAATQLMREGLRVGVPRARMPAAFTGTGGVTDEQLYALAQDVKARGGNITPGAEVIQDSVDRALGQSAAFSAAGAGATKEVAALKDSIDNLRKVLEAKAAPVNRPLAPALPGAPPGVNRGPAG